MQMARRNIPSSHHVATTGADGEAPPSTIAAKIVNNHEAAAAQRQPEDRKAFGQLLQEILANPAAENPDATLSYKLVAVMAEAGLNVLAKGQSDPFFPRDQLISQAIDSILVMEMIIQKYPELLLERTSAFPNGVLPAQLFLYLFPKILSVLGREHCEALVPSLTKLLSSCLSIPLRTIDLWHNALTLTELYQACIDVILDAIESLTIPAYHSSSFNVILPPAQSISKLCGESEQLVTVPKGCQTEVTSPYQSILIGLTLLNVIAIPDDEGSFGDLTALTRGKTRGWVAHCLFRFSRRIMFWATLSENASLVDQVLTSYLRAISNLYQSYNNQPPDVFQRCKLSSLYPILAELLQFCFKRPFSQEAQLELARCLMGSLALSDYPDAVTQGSVEALSTVATSIASNENYKQLLLDDLQIMIRILFDRLRNKPRIMLQSRSPRTSESTNDMPHFIDNELSEGFRKAAQSRQVLTSNSERHAKRRRTADNNTSAFNADPYQTIARQVSSLLSGQESHGFSGMSKRALECYETLLEEDRCRFLIALSKLPCAATDCLEKITTTNWDFASIRCTLCDTTSRVSVAPPRKPWDGGDRQNDWNEIYSSIVQILGSPLLQKSPKPRVFATVAINRFINHSLEVSALDLATGPLGQWCMRSLHSSLRALRIAAGHALPAFLRDEVSEDLRKKNRIYALDFLRALADRKEVAEQETLILAWGRIARLCGSEELNITLLTLVEHLGNANAFISGVASNELSQLAEWFECSPEELMRPFWRSLSVMVVLSLHTRPQMAQNLADLLGKSVSQFLLLTQTETIPYLVLMKRQDILSRIAAARGTSVHNTCTQPRKTLAAILALLLLQPSPDVERTSMDLLRQAAPGFGEDDLATWVKLEPVMIACEMLKVAGDEQQSNRARIHQAICTFATLAERKAGHSKSVLKQEKMVAAFFETHVLGIMAYFSDVIDSTLHPMTEKMRALGGIEEMLVIAKSYVSVALPQIRACLQSAFKISELRDQAFSAWALLLTSVDEEDFAALAEHTLSLIVQNWSSFSLRTQERAHNLVANVLKTHNALIRDNIQMLPSMASIPLMSKFDSEITRLKAKLDLSSHFQAFSLRCQDENAVVVLQALTELVVFLEENQRFIHESAVSQLPSPVVARLTRALLDVCVKFIEGNAEILRLCSRCLGLVGCLDPSRVEAIRDKKEMLVLSNFELANEAVDFVTFLLEGVLIKAFYSATNARAQGFLAYAMQELLRFCEFSQVANYRPRASQPNVAYQRWMEIPENTRNTLTPFLSSRYLLVRNAPMPPELANRPIFSPEISHGAWLRTFVFDLLRRGKGENAKMIFSVLSRVIRGHDVSIASFLLPFAALNIILGGTDQEADDVGQEMLAVLKSEVSESGLYEAETIRQCSENVFQVLDYLLRFIQGKKKSLESAKTTALRLGKAPSELDEVRDVAQISSVERILAVLPAEVISKRALECGSYARALFHWEQYIRQEKDKLQEPKDQPDEVLYQYLQTIYSSIDDPDAIEGISTHLHVLNPDQQVLEHRKAGRWAAAQSWYELILAEQPSNTEIQLQLLQCLRESGQYDSLLNYAEKFISSSTTPQPRVLSFAAEASWITGKWQFLEERISASVEPSLQEFDVAIGSALIAMRRRNTEQFLAIIASLRDAAIRALTPSNTSSIQTSHEPMLRLHVLYEIEAISGMSDNVKQDRAMIVDTLDRRLEVLGSYLSDKRYLLGIRRAAMQASRLEFTNLDIASAWLKTARLARKANFVSTAFNAVLHAFQLGDDSAKIEHSRLLWKGGQHRKAIQTLRGAIDTNAFQAHSFAPLEEEISITTDKNVQENIVSARARLLLGKWLDNSGQTPSSVIRETYLTAVTSHPRWAKGHYYLGTYYNKIIESEKALPRTKQTEAYLSGELAKAVVESYLRSTCFGTKYNHQMIPKMLTLWLDLGMDVHNGRRTSEPELAANRQLSLGQMNRQLRKYWDRLPAYIFYIALPQLITRISHPNKEVYDVLSSIIIKIVATYPQQALWGLLAVSKSSNPDRSKRGMSLLNAVKDYPKSKRKESVIELRNLVTQGQRLSDQLLAACEAPVENKVTHVSLSRDLGFSHKIAPCALVVPIESTLTLSLPTAEGGQAIKHHKPFPRDAVTISAFSDDVLVLLSLQRPRKLQVRGSDGRNYGLLCKPKDDLRKDQRLMEFNSMINRALKRDVESSKRRLYIKTYGVTPLNEECGTIEWVDNLKPLRDIILQLYRQKSVKIDYGELRALLAEACADPRNLPIFTEHILPHFKPVLHEWFVEIFPTPETWYAARLRYTRSCAVMSIVGHILGLGDRHGENILLQEGNGGVFHVDFNCLFDKGLTFDKPEVVPFRLTHNMVDAMGAYGYEGPFRKAAELTLTILRQHEDTLMTILETFLYDPTTDFIGKKKRSTPGVPETPQEVLESVRTKLRGLLHGESVPLSVEGYVDALVTMARDPAKLAAMYIGWCSFF